MSEILTSSNSRSVPRWIKVLSAIAVVAMLAAAVAGFVVSGVTASTITMAGLMVAMSGLQWSTILTRPTRR